MKRLTLEQKRFLVRSLATFQTPTEAARAFAKKFDFEITRQVAETFDPTAAAGANLGEELTALFWETRKKAETEEQAVPIFWRAYRLRRRQAQLERFDAYREAAPAKAIGLKLEVERREDVVLEKVAKELGGLYERGKQEGEQADTGAQAHFESALEKAYPDEALPGE
jgi:hypothetical protein